MIYAHNVFVQIMQGCPVSGVGVLVQEKKE